MGTVDQEKLKKLEAVKLSLEKDFGKGIVSKLNSGAIEGVDFLPTSIMEFDELSGGGFPRGRIIEIYGPESCLAFDTKIPYASLKENGKVQNHKGGTIENLYYRFHNIKRKGIGNYIRSQSTESKYYVASINEENKIFRNEIADVVKTGVKECFLLKTEKRTIEATKDHKFFNGEEYVALEKLNKGDTVYVHNNIPFRKEHKKIKYKEVLVKYHPTGRKKTVEDKYTYYRLHNSHFVYEANENNMSIEEYRNYLNNESKEKINKLWTVPKNMDIHHKDTNSLNDSLDNLLLIDKSEHYRLHATENHNNMRFVVVPEKIISIKSVGEKETYDIKCFSPYNNFIANGFVVHNSGKTTLALHAIESAQRAGGVCAFVDMEHALDPVYAQNLGVDIDNLWVSQPESGEQGLEVTEQMVTSGVVDVVVFDSVAAAIPQKELDGEYGDSNMGLQARLMSQAMRKLTGTISKTNCIVIFINQIRHKIGVMFGCFSYNTRVCLSDGTTEKIGKIVNQKMDVEVLSFNPDTDRIESKKIINYFNNGKAESFLDFVVEKPYGNGRSNFSCTKNHIILTPEGEVNASDLKVNDYVLGQGKYLFSKEQEEVIIGSLLGDGCICSPTNRFKVAHGIKQNEYCLYKMSLFSNLNPIQYNHAKGGIAFEIGNSEELNYYRSLCYGVDNKKRLITKEFISKLTEKAIAIWFMDDGNLSGSHTKWGNGKIAISVKSYSFEEIELLKNYLSDNGYGEATITKTKRLEFNGTESEKFQFKIAKWIHPSMRYKIIERFHTIPFEAINPNFKKPMYKLVPRKILSIKESSKKRSMVKFDLEIEDNHNYLVDGVGVHNSPETTTGGNALKFYSSQRFEIRKIETITGKDSEDATANKVRVKCVKNKVAPPFKKAEFLIEFGKGFNKMDSLINTAVKLEVIDKKGAWYSYKEEKIGQGKENVLKFLTENPELYNEVYSICSDRLFKKCINTQKAEVVEEKKKKVKKEKDIEISIDAPEEDTIEQESME